MANFTFTPQELSETAKKFNKELQTAMLLGLGDAAKHMTKKTGVRYKEVISNVDGNFEVGNYSKTKKGNNNVDISGRTFQTFKGNLVESIDPNAILDSAWGANTMHADKMANTPAALIVATHIMKKVSEKMFYNLFTAKHDPADTSKTEKWFDGFCTVIEKDIKGTNDEKKVSISKALGNLTTFAKIDDTNAEDILRAMWRGCDPVLRNQAVKMYISDNTYFAYEDAYQLNHGHAPFNTEVEQKFLIGTNKHVELVPLSNMPDDYVIITPASNMKLVFNNESDDDRLYFLPSLSSHYEVDALVDKFFGTQFVRVDKDIFTVGMTEAALTAINTPEEGA